MARSNRNSEPDEVRACSAYTKSRPPTQADAMHHDPELVRDILPRVIAQITTRTKQILVVELPEPKP